MHDLFKIISIYLFKIDYKLSYSFTLAISIILLSCTDCTHICFH